MAEQLACNFVVAPQNQFTSDEQYAKYLDLVRYVVGVCGNVGDQFCESGGARIVVGRARGVSFCAHASLVAGCSGGACAYECPGAEGFAGSEPGVCRESNARVGRVATQPVVDASIGQRDNSSIRFGDTGGDCCVSSSDWRKGAGSYARVSHELKVGTGEGGGVETKKIRVKGKLVEVTVEEKTRMNRAARVKAKARKLRKQERVREESEHPFGFWASCARGVRERLVNSKAEMHIAENEKRAAEARARRDLIGSPQACADRVMELMSKGEKISVDPNTPMGRVAGWAKTVYSDSAVDVAKSAPPSAPSFVSFDAEQVQKIVDSRIADSEARVAVLESKLAEVSEELKVSRNQNASNRGTGSRLGREKAVTVQGHQVARGAKYYRIPFAGDGTDPFASVQVVSGVKIRTNFDTSDPERLPVMSEFGGDEDAYIAALLSHRKIHDKWRDAPYPAGDHRRKKPGESNQEHFERLQRMSEAEREALPDFSKLGY